MDKWICNKCGFVTFEKPVKRVATCAKCHSGRYRLIKTCVCGTSDEPIEAHHLKPVKDYPDLIYDVDNGLTLCYKCHKAEHKAMRKLIK